MTTTMAKILFNPRWSPDEKQQLQQLFENYARADEVWVASSGSSQNAQQSAKLIALSNKAIDAAALAVNQFFNASTQDIWLQILPSFHVGGMSIRRRADLAGSGCIEVAPNWKWDAANFCQLLQENQITLTALVPTQVFDLVQAGMRPPQSLRAVLIGGAAMNADLLKSARTLGWPLLPSFGMTETCAAIAIAPLSQALDPENVSPWFQTLSHVQVKKNAEGLLQIRGSSLLRGWAQIVSGEMMFEALPDNGWLTTSDLVELSDIGFIKILGRQGDYCKINGEGVSLSVLREHLDNLITKQWPELFGQFALVATPDPRAGHALVLACSSAAFTKGLAVIAAFNADAKPYERIARCADVGVIPKTDLGKIAYGKLKTISSPL